MQKSELINALKLLGFVAVAFIFMAGLRETGIWGALNWLFMSALYLVVAAGAAFVVYTLAKHVFDHLRGKS